MPNSIQPLLTISPALPPQVLQQLQKILNAVARGAFGQQSDFRILLVMNGTHADMQLEFPPEAPQDVPREIALRTAETSLQLIGALAKNLGVPTRTSNTPSRRMLRLTGLTWHLVRHRLSKIVAALESPTLIELTCAHSAARLRITAGRPLGCAAPPPAYLCGTVIRRRATSFGEVVRVRSGRTPMSVVVPREIGAAAVSDGVLISTTPVVGLIPRRIVSIARCQLSMFRDN